MTTRHCALLAATLLGGCGTAVGAPPQVMGNAVMQWTVDERTAANSCDTHGATTFQVSLYNAAGGFAGQWVQDCSAYATTIYGLSPDDYNGHAELTDASGRAVSTSVSIQTFTVVGGSTAIVPIDFPADSFY